MNGYWVYNKGVANAATPSLLNNNIEIGLPPIIAGNLINNNLSANCNSLLNLNYLTFSNNVLFSNYPSSSLRSGLYYSIADYNPSCSIPNNWHGYTTNLIDSVEQGYNKTFISDSVVKTSATFYKIKFKIIRLTPTSLSEIPNNLNNIEDVKTMFNYINQYWRLNMTDNTILNLPTWTGELASQFIGESGIYTNKIYKQNKHYCSIKSGSAPSQYIYKNGLYMYRPSIKNFGDYNIYNYLQQQPLDVSVGPCSIFRNGYKIRNNITTNYKTDICYNSISQSGLPFYFNLCRNGLRMFTSSGETEDIYNWNKYLITTSNTNNNYNYYGVNSDNICTPIPFIQSNQIVHFGDGNGILDTPLIDNYEYNNIIYNKNDVSRYCYIQGNNQNKLSYIYIIIGYLTNEIEIATHNNNIPDKFYGHIVQNN